MIAHHTAHRTHGPAHVGGRCRTRTCDPLLVREVLSPSEPSAPGSRASQATGRRQTQTPAAEHARAAPPVRACWQRWAPALAVAEVKELPAAGLTGPSPRLIADQDASGVVPHAMIRVEVDVRVEAAAGDGAQVERSRAQHPHLPDRQVSAGTTRHADNGPCAARLPAGPDQAPIEICPPPATAVNSSPETRCRTSPATGPSASTTHKLMQ